MRVDRYEPGQTLLVALQYSCTYTSMSASSLCWGSGRPQAHNQKVQYGNPPLDTSRNMYTAWYVIGLIISRYNEHFEYSSTNILRCLKKEDIPFKPKAQLIPI